MDILPYEERVRPLLSDHRFYHSQCVSLCARILAERFGADTDKAELAGILHDVMKDLPPKKQLQKLSDYGIELTPVERRAQKLWHSVLGAAYLEREGITDDRDILNAVRYHTTGRAGMSKLEQVVFVADFISADREYPGIERLREAAQESLSGALLQGMAYTIVELAAANVPIHPDTVAAYNEICLQKAAKKG